jgi:hypothetical protein
MVEPGPVAKRSATGPVGSPPGAACPAENKARAGPPCPHWPARLREQLSASCFRNQDQPKGTAAASGARCPVLPALNAVSGLVNSTGRGPAERDYVRAWPRTFWIDVMSGTRACYQPRAMPQITVRGCPLDSNSGLTAEGEDA